MPLPQTPILKNPENSFYGWVWSPSPTLKKKKKEKWMHSWGMGWLYVSLKKASW